MVQPSNRRFVMEDHLDSSLAALVTNLPNTVQQINNLDYAKFDTTYAGGSTQPGMVAWNDVDGTLEFQLKGGNVTLQLGQEQVIRVKNNTGFTITNGSVVYISGSDGNNLRVAKAKADAENTSSGTIGVATEDLINGQGAYVTTFGLVRGIDTSALTEGAPVWLSDTTAGAMTSTRPVAPSHGVMIGFCLRSHAVNGVMFVRVDNGWELDELHNVLISNPQDKQVLAYEGGLWKNKAATGGVTVGASAPASPSPGDAWFDSNDGTLYVWYVDANTSQWVQVQANSALEGTILARLSALEGTTAAFGNMSYNYILNGAFDVWQRGTSFSVTNANTYTADRWESIYNVAGGSSATVSRQSAGLNGFQYCIRAQRSSGKTFTTPFGIAQAFESSISTDFIGSTATLSFWARVGSNFSGTGLTASIIYGTGTDQSIRSGFTGVTTVATNTVTPSTSWQRFTVTGSVSALATQVGIQISYNPVGTAGANDYVEITGVQLERGSIATTFRRNSSSLEAELAACQRYYYRLNAGVGGVGVPILAWGAAVATTVIDVPLPLPVTMRTNVSLAEISGIGTYCLPNGSFSGGTFTIAYTSQSLPIIRYTHGTAVYTANALAEFINTGATAGYISVTAEL